MSTIVPDKVLAALSANARQQKRHNLEVVHQVCAGLHRIGSMDFSLATVGRLSQERGGISQRALYNAASKDFKTLIHSWADLATNGTKSAADRKSRDGLQDDGSLLKKIDDPALRTLVGYIIAERDRLRGEVKLLRAHANVIIDNRVLPGHVNVTSTGSVIQVLNSVGLTEMENQALSRAVSVEFLAQEGWSEGPNGEILNSRGRTLFDIGFANSIRKILAAQ